MQTVEREQIPALLVESLAQMAADAPAGAAEFPDAEARVLAALAQLPERDAVSWAELSSAAEAAGISGDTLREADRTLTRRARTSLAIKLGLLTIAGLLGFALLRQLA